MWKARRGILVPHAALLVPAAGGGGAWAGPSTGLTHRWAMDTAGVVSATVTDPVGALNGTRTGDAVINGGGTAIVFNTAGSVTLASVPTPAITGAHSVFFWLKLVDVSVTGGGGSFQTPIGFFESSGNTVRLLNSGGLFVVAINKASSALEYATTVPQIVSGVDVHLGYNWDGSAVTAVYVNGASVGFASAPAGYATPSDNNIGSRGSSFVGGIDGEMHGVVIYSNTSVDAALVYAAG